MNLSQTYEAIAHRWRPRRIKLFFGADKKLANKLASLSNIFKVALFDVAPGIAADIYGYVDDEGVAHFSDVPDSVEYRLILRDGVKDTKAAAIRRPQADRAASYAEAIRREAASNRLDPLLLDAMIHVESGHDSSAVSRRGAKGLMQLMPATAARYGVANPLQAESNIQGGARYLRDLLDLFDDDLNLALAAYNSGENAVLRYHRQIPPYAETRSYIPKVLHRYAELQAAQAGQRRP